MLPHDPHEEFQGVPRCAGSGLSEMQGLRVREGLISVVASDVSAP